MKVKFYKYQATGNDFIFFDGRGDVSILKDNKPLIARLCDRKFGIGADGLIILEKDKHSDFRMVYYNSDGGESTMCGNGGRCSIAFAHQIGMSGIETRFTAVDGGHDGVIGEGDWISLGMINVPEIKRLDDQTFELNTGSPHFVRILQDNERVDIVEFGRTIRYSLEYRKDGINVNTVRIGEDSIYVETYERGVEDQTLSCGTGVTACALAYYLYAREQVGKEVLVDTAGGRLKVSFSVVNGGFEDIVLSGPAKKVFDGEVDLEEV